MPPSQPLPFSPEFANPDDYVDSLLDFVTNSSLLRILCGGVHILDFFTSEPQLYAHVIPQPWREFFRAHEMMDLLDLFMRENLAQFDDGPTSWRDGLAPPPDLVEYLRSVRKHLLHRAPATSQCSRNRAMKPAQKLAWHVAVGMTVKKVHEVGLFSRYVHDLIHDISETVGSETSHLVDFGSGQNYLGRALASSPYNHDIVAIESRSHNTERAKEFDIMARLAEKPPSKWCNKKAARAGLEDTTVTPSAPPGTIRSEKSAKAAASLQASSDGSVELPPQGHGRIQYISHRITSPDLSTVTHEITPSSNQQNLMIISLHSCGNLVHHGLRSLTHNPSVRAVAMVGCCYNLLTERLGPATYKLPELRPTTHSHPRLEKTGEARDPDGFPMSARFCNAEIRLNITSRMMAVQAPQNWGRKDSEAFFTRHFYRALLQRIFLDKGIVSAPTKDCVGGGLSMSDDGVNVNAVQSPRGHSSGGTPVIIGSLRKGCYDSFVAYVRGAMEKLCRDENRARANVFQEGMKNVSDDEIRAYEDKYAEKKKDLSVCWSLMAFSAGVIEAAIVVDRWLWLKEQEDVVERAWVESVFDYKLSPRNLVVVGIKKKEV